MDMPTFQGLYLTVLDPSGLKKPRLMSQAAHGLPIIRRRYHSWERFIPGVVFGGAAFFLSRLEASTSTPPLPGLQQLTAAITVLGVFIGVVSVIAILVTRAFDDGDLVMGRHVVDTQAIDTRDIEWVTAHTAHQLMDHAEALSASELRQTDALRYDTNRLLLLSYRNREAGKDHLARQYRQQADKSMNGLRALIDASEQKRQTASRSIVNLRLQELAATDPAAHPAEPDGFTLAGHEPTSLQGTFEIYQPDQPEDTTWRLEKGTSALRHWFGRWGKCGRS